MLRRSFALAILVLIPISLLHAADEPKMEFKPFHSEKGRFTIQIPGKPEEKSQEIDSGTGKTHLYMVTVEINKDLAFLVTYNDYEKEIADEDPQTVLKRVRDGNAGEDGKLLEDKEGKFSIANIPSRSLLIQKGDLFMRNEVILAKNRLYQIMMVSTKKEDVTGESAKKYYDSFGLTK